VKKKVSDISETDAFQHLSFTRIDPSTFANILRRTRVLDFAGTVTRADTSVWSQNVDVSLWLGTVVPSTANRYLIDLLYYSKCVNLAPPALLDLKMSEEPKNRYFPAEQLLQNWINLADKKKFYPSKIFSTVCATKSFYAHSRVPLIKVDYVYRPRPKQQLTKELFRNFREGFNNNFYNQVLFDFLISVPLRDGQFLQCKHCGVESFPRWQHIETYPKIEPGSAFVIKPAKGHQSKKYRDDLRQVCFLTETAAAQLNALRDLKEAMLHRKLRPEDYILLTK
jgi:hypothetical protein